MSHHRNGRRGARRSFVTAVVIASFASHASAGPGCLTSGPAWESVAFPAKSGPFSFTFDATPADAPIDAITALASGEGATFDDFACLIRFNPSGLVDVRNGADYAHDADVPYAAGQTLHFRVEIDVERHAYTVFVTPGGEDEVLLACGYDFRTSQQQVASLDHWAVWASDGFEHDTCSASADSGGPAPIAVPADHATIQAAIDAASSGDEIVVAPGSYNETIDFRGKHIALRSSGGRNVTTIDATGLDGSVVTCSSCEGPAVLEGFEITGGIGTFLGPPYSCAGSFLGFAGGGAFVKNASLAIAQCAFVFNTAHEVATMCRGFGGALYASGAAVEIDGCLFTINSAYHGGALYLSGGSASITNCAFVENSGMSDSLGGALYAGGQVTCSGCSFIDNHANYGGAIYVPYSTAPFTTKHIINGSFVGNGALAGGAIDATSGPPGADVNTIIINSSFVSNSANQVGGVVGHASVFNCIFWNNEATPSPGGPEREQLGVVSVSHSCIEGLNAYAGNGNIGAVPLFADLDGADDTPGTEDDDVRLAPGSPCIDAADNAALPPEVLTDLAGSPRFIDDAATPDTGSGSAPIVDMGAFEFFQCPADIDGNGDVGFGDLVLLLVDWGPCPLGSCPADIDGNGDIGFGDLALLLIGWGSCT